MGRDGGRGLGLGYGEERVSTCVWEEGELPPLLLLWRILCAALLVGSCLPGAVPRLVLSGSVWFCLGLSGARCRCVCACARRRSVSGSVWFCLVLSGSVRSPLSHLSLLSPLSALSFS